MRSVLPTGMSRVAVTCFGLSAIVQWVSPPARGKAGQMAARQAARERQQAARKRLIGTYSLADFDLGPQTEGLLGNGRALRDSWSSMLKAPGQVSKGPIESAYGLG